MESGIKILTGLVLLCVSLAYLYRPAVVLRVNDWVRTLFFNDAHLLHYRRQWGLLAFLASILFLYSGFLNLAASRRPSVPDPDPLIEGYRAFYEQRFDEAAAVALKQLKTNPSDPHSTFLLRQSRSSKSKR